MVSLVREVQSSGRSGDTHQARSVNVNLNLTTNTVIPQFLRARKAVIALQKPSFF